MKKILLISLISLIISGCVKTITPSSLEQVSKECMKDYILSKKFVEMSYKKDNYEYNPILFDFANESNLKKLTESELSDYMKSCSIKIEENKDGDILTMIAIDKSNKKIGTIKMKKTKTNL